jgi:hypothetical protein
MANFDSGVASYIHAQAKVDVFFPVDFKGNADISCNQCYFFRRSYKTCGLNGEVCQYPEKYVGASCPLEEVEEE